MTVALLVAVGAAEAGRDALMFLTKEAVRLATEGVALGVACEGCPPIPDLMKRFEAAGGVLLDLPDLLQRQEARRGHARVQRPAGRNRPAVGVDRRRRDHLQLLTTRRKRREDRR